MIREFNSEETVALQSIVAVDGTSRKEVISSIRASNVLEGAPGAILGHAKRAGLIKIDGETIYLLINNKGGEEQEKTISEGKTIPEGKKLTPEEMEIRKYIIQKKFHYRDKTIDGKQVWGISYKAIVLVDNVIIDPETDRRNFNGKKEFHHFFRKINQETLDDGVELAKRLIKKYRE